MKRVLFVIPSFTVGGTITSLLSLLPVIRNKYDISLYARSSLGTERNSFQSYNVLKENIWLSTTIRSQGPFVYCVSRIIQLTSKLLRYCGINISPLLAKIGCKKINVSSYDLVISYQESLAGFVKFFPCKKACWIHSDISRGGKRGINDFASFDYIICVSYFAKDSFLSVYPRLSDKVFVIYNNIDEERILENSSLATNQDSHFDTSKFTLISVGRFDPVKQFDKIPYIAKRIKERIGDRFVWYIVGCSPHYYNYQSLIQADINKLGLSSEVVLIDEKNNVYPYIKASDLLVITSESETFSLVAFEARVLGTPIIMNDIPIAREIIKDKSGYIATIEEMPDIISEFYRNPFRVKSFIRLSSQSLSIFNSIVG